MSEWVGLPLPSPGDLLDSGIKPPPPALQVDSFTAESPEKPTHAWKIRPPTHTHTHEILLSHYKNEGFPVAQTVKSLPAMRETQVQSLGWEDPPWRMNWQPTPVFLTGGFHGQRSLVGYSPWNRKESETTEQPTSSFFSKKNELLPFAATCMNIEITILRERQLISLICEIQNSINKLIYRSGTENLCLPMGKEGV